MEYQNITLSVPKSILIKVKHIAVEKRTSVSQLLVESMEDMANKNDLYEQAMRRNLQKLDKYSLETKGNITISRDDIHE